MFISGNRILGLKAVSLNVSSRYCLSFGTFSFVGGYGMVSGCSGIFVGWVPDVAGGGTLSDAITEGWVMDESLMCATDEFVDF